MRVPCIHIYNGVFRAIKLRFPCIHNLRDRRSVHSVTHSTAWGHLGTILERIGYNRMTPEYHLRRAHSVNGDRHVASQGWLNTLLLPSPQLILCYPHPTDESILN